MHDFTKFISHNCDSKETNIYTVLLLSHCQETMNITIQHQDIMNMNAGMHGFMKFISHNCDS